MSESYIVVIHDHVPQISLPHPPLLRSRPHSHRTSSRRRRRRAFVVSFYRALMMNQSFFFFFKRANKCDFFFFFKEKKKATVFSFFLSPQTEQLFPPQNNTSLSLLLIDSRLKRSLTANFEPRVLLKTRTREREPKESSLLQRTGVKLCPPPLLSRRLLLLKMD